MRRAICLLVTARAYASPNDFVARPLVLDAGQLDAELVTEINLHPAEFAQPLSFAPDVWYGVTPRLTAGLVHGNPSADRFAAGASFCVLQHVDRCETTYHGSGLDVRFGAIAGAFAVAPRLRLIINDHFPAETDPIKPALTLGALVRFTFGRFAIRGDPYLQLGLANTDRGNRHAVFLPITLAGQPVARWELAVHTGVNTVFAVGYCHVPLAIETRVAVMSQLDLGAMVGWTDLLGCQPTGQERAAFFTIAWRTNTGTDSHAAAAASSASAP